MQDVVLKIIERAPEPNGVWVAELWSGFPGAADAALIGGPGPAFTQAQLEAPSVSGTALDRASVLKKIREDGRQDQALADIGRRLFEFLEAVGVTTELSKRRVAEDGSAAPDRGVRLYLDLPEFIAEWPWELLLWRSTAGIFDPAFIIERHPMLRIATPTQPQLAWTDATVRVLLVSGQEQLDPNDPSQTASRELRLIRKIFQKADVSVIVELCEAPDSIPELENRIRDASPHVLHFIGHGDIDTETPGAEFALQFKGQSAGEWSVPQIRSFFDNSSWKPRLIVLNSCHSSEPHKHALPVAKALLDVGVAAVIGAQAALRVDYARDFSETFYSALATTQTLDRALASARRALTTKDNFAGDKRRHWALPVLSVRGPVNQVLRFKRANASITVCEESKRVYERPGRFVNRSADRRSVLSAFRPIEPGAQRFRGVILMSDTSEVGKDWLMKRSVRDFLDNDYLVRYASLVSDVPTARTSLDVLLEWRGRPGFRSPILSPIPGTEFDEFDQALAAARLNTDAKHVEEVFRTFKSALQRVRGQRDVLLILGRFRKSGKPTVTSGDFHTYLLEKLLLPVVEENPELAGIHALLVARTHRDLDGQPSDFDEFGLQRLSLEVSEDARQPADGFRRIKVKEFDKKDLINYFDEFAEFAEGQEAAALQTVVQGTVPGKSWRPNELNVLDGLVIKLGQVLGGGR